MSTTELHTFSKAEIDAMPTAGGSTGTDHVVVLGARSAAGEWRYVVTDPMTARKAQEAIDLLYKTGRLGPDSVAFTRPVPMLDLNRPPCDEEP